MTGVNHVLTGALIAAVIPEPALGLPLAFASHFTLDALPHFGNHPVAKWGSHQHRRIVITDAILCLLVIAGIVLGRPTAWPLPVLGGLLAISPDAVWLPNYLRSNLHQPLKELGPVARLHKAIQTAERPWGIAFEIIWLALVGILFFLLVIR